MSAMTNVEVVIDGKVYTLSGYEGQDYLQKVAAYINGKISEFHALDYAKHLSNDMKHTFIQINIADDYFKAKGQVENLEQEIERKDCEIYDLKHDLISCQMKCDDADEKIRQLEAQNQDLLLEKARLEASLKEGGNSKKNKKHKR